MSKRPSKVKILGVPFTIQYLDEIGEGETHGQTVGVDRSIKISLSKNDTPSKIESTLLHEIVHAVLYASGIAEVLTDGQDEAIAVALEHGLGSLYRRSFK